MPPRRFPAYDPKLRRLSRELRKNGTLPEVILWEQLRRKQVGVEFHRQAPVGRYIVDFFCPELALAIEVDGTTHESAESLEQDAERDKALGRLGITVLRFRNEDVLEHLAGVMEAVRERVLGLEKRNEDGRTSP